MYLVDFEDYHSGELFVKLIILKRLLQKLVSLPSHCGSYSGFGRDMNTLALIMIPWIFPKKCQPRTNICVFIYKGKMKHGPQKEAPNEKASASDILCPYDDRLHCLSGI
jgi:hypothetical protein